MCVITFQQSPLITKTDVTVFKVVERRRNNFCSLYSPFTYEYNKLYKTQFEELNSTTVCFDPIDFAQLNKYYPNWQKKIDESKDLKCIVRGFITALNRQRLKPVIERIPNLFLLECTIPKGSEIYLGVSSLCSSNQIIINRQITTVEKEEDDLTTHFFAEIKKEIAA